MVNCSHDTHHRVACAVCCARFEQRVREVEACLVQAAVLLSQASRIVELDQWRDDYDAWLTGLV